MFRPMFCLFLILSPLAPSEARAQIDAQQAASFFPLQTGNQWQYEVTFLPDPGPEQAYWTAAVVADTLMPNGKRYHVFTAPFLGTEYFRIDTTALVVYRYFAPVPGDQACLDSERVYFDLRAARIDGKQYGEFVVAVQQQAPPVPFEMELSQNYPNPFNPNTNIVFCLPRPGHVTLKVYNAQGAEVAALVAKNFPAGRHQVEWEAGRLAGGIYFCRLQVNAVSLATRKMLLLR